MFFRPEDSYMELKFKSVKLKDPISVCVDPRNVIYHHQLFHLDFK